MNLTKEEAIKSSLGLLNEIEGIVNLFYETSDKISENVVVPEGSLRALWPTYIIGKTIHS